MATQTAALRDLTRSRLGFRIAGAATTACPPRFDRAGAKDVGERRIATGRV
jgi:hypothetical protein